MADFGAPLLSELLSPEKLQLMQARAARRTYRNGDVIHDRGDDAPAMGIVVSGLVRMVSPRSNGRENLVAMITPGQNYGDAVATGRPRRAHRAIAVGETVIDHLDRAAFAPLLNDPEIVRALYIVAANRIVLLLDILDDLRALAPEARLAKMLMLLSESSDDRHGFEFIQEDFANLLGVSTVTLAKAIKTLRAEGLIETGYRRMTIRDPEALQAWLAVNDPD